MKGPKLPNAGFVAVAACRMAAVLVGGIHKPVLGALINAFNADNGKVNEAGSHQLAAFVMAVNGESMRDFYNTTGNIAQKSPG